MKVNKAWEENQKWLEEKMPLIFSKIQEREDNNLQITVKETQKNWNIHVEKKGQFSFYVHSLYDRQREYQMMIRNVLSEHKTLVLFGAVCLDCLRYLAKNCPNIRHLILIEPHVPVFQAFLRQWMIVDAFGVFSKVSLIVGENEETVKDRIKQALATGTFGEKTVALSGGINYQWHFREYMTAIQAATAESIRFSRVNRATVRSFRDLWLLNTWHNISYGDADMEDFMDDFKNCPAIIVSAGPSLDKNIRLLEKAKDKALVIAVGSAMTILEAREIKPHLRMVIDPDFLNEEIFRNLDTNEIPLAYSEHSYYKILPDYNAPKIQINLEINSSITQHLREISGITKKTIDSGFSVANVAANLLSFWKCNPIVFVGQDLAYTEERLHAKGSWDNEFESKYIFKHFIRKDINGQDVYTDEAFEGMRQTFERTISLNPQIKFFNATEGGVAIQGAPNRTLEELLAEWTDLSCDYSSIINEKIQQLRSSGVHEARKSTLHQNASIFKREMEEYLSKLEQGKKLSRRLLKKEQAISEKEAKQILRKISQIETDPMDGIVSKMFEDEFFLRREGYLWRQREKSNFLPQVQLFFLEVSEKAEYARRFLQLITWYIKGEEFKVVVN